MVPCGTVSEIVRPRISQRLIDKTRKLVGFPESVTFNDTLEEVLKRYSKILGGKK